MISSSNSVTLRTDAPSATIVLNRPESCNAISTDMIQKLLNAFSDLHQEKKVRAVILTGAGDYFSAGSDLKEVQAQSEDEKSLELWHEHAQSFCELLETMLRFPKPIIAALNGTVLGFGASLMLACDYVLASEKAKFGLPEAKLGLVANHATPLLSFRLGAGQAARLLMLAEPIESNEAQRIGLFHELVADNLVWVRANELASKYATNSPQSIQLTKQMLNETIGEEMISQLMIGSANVAAARTTESAQEGVAAFLEKRDPEW